MTDSEGDQAPVEKEEMVVGVVVITPTGTKISLGDVPIAEEVQAIKNSLWELVETGAHTNYRLVCVSTGEEWNEFAEIAKYVMTDEAGGQEGEVATPRTRNVELRMVHNDYDVRSARKHVRRLRDMLQQPPMHVSSATLNGAKPALVELPSSPAPPSAPVAANDGAANDGATKANLSDYYHSCVYQLCPQPEVLHCDVPLSASGSTVKIAKSSKRGGMIEAGSALRAVVQDISISGYNPPPPPRALMGDLLYLEIRVLDSPGTAITFHVTATASGFFVNKSSRTVFDPAPADEAHFSPILLNTVLSRAANARKVYSAYVRALLTVQVEQEQEREKEKENEKEADGKADDSEAEVNILHGRVDQVEANLAHVGFLLRTGQGQRLLVNPHWLATPRDELTPENESRGASRTTVAHKWNSSRAQQSITEALPLGSDELPREWNEHFQSILALGGSSPSGAVDPTVALSKRKFLARVLQDYKESCEGAGKAMVDGLLTPLNPGEPREQHVYLYNNTYFSLSVDNVEQVKLCKGDIAHRKCVQHDMKNQTAIRMAEVPGVHTVLTSIVDYKGHRVLCQTPIPGILSTTTPNMATLVYGSLDMGSDISCKKDALELMKALGDKLGVKQTTVKQCPWNDEALSLAQKERELRLAMAKQEIFFEAEADGEVDEAALGNSIIVNKENEVEPTVVDGASFVPHVGPLEGKLIEGSDKRVYALEMIRLQPRDANYVGSDRGGTGHITDEDLKHVGEEDGLPSAFLLRPELRSAFLVSKRAKIRQEVLAKTTELGQKLMKDEEEQRAKEKEEEEAAAKEKGSEGEDAQEGEEKKEEKKEEQPRLSEAAMKQVADLRLTLSKEAEEKMKPFENLSLNPNVFLPENAMLDAEEKERDEEMVRQMSTFLYTELLPNLVEQARTDEYSMYDGESLTATLHICGVNMRYCGRLATLAAEGEASDEALKAQQRIRRNPLPHSFLEILQTEILARSIKHLLNAWMRGDDRVGAQVEPAQLLLAILNYTFSTAMGRANAIDSAATQSSGEGKKGGKRNKAAAKAMHADGVSLLLGQWTERAVPTTASTSALPSRESFVAALGEHMKRHFNYDIVKLYPTADADLSSRLGRIPLLRRICQQCGVTLVARDYDLDSSEPFRLQDIQDVHAKVRVCDSSDIFFPELEHMLSRIKLDMSARDYARAYQLSQEAAAWAAQVHGSVHPSIIEVQSQLTSLLVEVGDWGSALAMSSKVLALKIQCYGPDSYRVLQQHMHVAQIALQVSASLTSTNAKHAADAHQFCTIAEKHWLAAKYISAVTCSPSAPHLLSINLGLAQAFRKSQQLHKALDLLLAMYTAESAREQMHPEKKLLVTQNLSRAYEEAAETEQKPELAVEYIGKAVALFRETMYLVTMLNGGIDAPKMAQMSEELKAMRRREVEMGLNQAKHRQQTEAVRKAEEQQSWLDSATLNDDVGGGGKKSQQQKKKKKKGKK